MAGVRWILLRHWRRAVLSISTRTSSSAKKSDDLNRNPSNVAENEHLSFHLSDEFVAKYKDRRPPWGFDVGGGNSLGEITWFTKYARTKNDGTKERWFEGCRRVVEGTYSILRDHCAVHRTPWNGMKSQRAAEDMYDRLWSMKWTPPGRGLWMMGNPFIFEEGSAALQSCAFLSTEKLGLRNPTLPFVRLMEMSMLGIGVGFDTKGAGKLDVHAPLEAVSTYVIPDSREGWCESLDLLLRSYLLPNRETVEFDYSLIRPAGAPIKRFGGTAAGPASLIRLHVEIRKILDAAIGTSITSTLIVDINNMTGKCVVAGNVRRSAELALGEPDDIEFLELKDWEKNPERNGMDGWGHLSNNSILATVGMNLDHVARQVVNRGEPGILFVDLMRSHGRLTDPKNDKDWRAKGANPCHSGDTLMLTKDNGMVRIADLADTSFTLWNGEEWSRSTAWRSGVKPVFRVELVNGQSIDITEDHRLAIWTEGDSAGRGAVEREATVSEIATLVGAGRGPKVKPFVGFPEWDGEVVDEEDAVLAGLLMGDGYTSNRSTSAYIKTREVEVLDFLRLMDPGEWSIVDPVDDVAGVTRLDGMVKAMSAIGIDIRTNLPDRAFPSSVMQWSSDSQRWLLKGLFSANGSAMSKYGRIELKTTCRDLAGQVQTMLLALGFSAYITTNKATEIEWENGVYESRESYDVNISGREQFERFQDEIGFLHLHKSERLGGVIPNRKQPKATRVASVTPLGTMDVYDFTEPLIHWGWANGFKSHNCAEQTLEDNECVTFDTRIQTRTGIPKIGDVVGHEVDVWNGEQWASVVPFSTGERMVYRIGLSDGSYLEASDNHEWSVRRRTARSFKRVRTEALEVGMVLPEFALDMVDGKPQEYAYQWGWMAGDGYVDGVRAMALVQEDEYDVLDLLGGVVYKEQQHTSGKKFSRVNLTSMVGVEDARKLRDHESGLPEDVFGWDGESLAEFFGAWVDTDGSLIQNPNTDHYLIYGSEQKLRDAQVLLRRIGVNHANLSLFAPKGATTNKGERNYAIWRLLIPSYEAAAIKTYLKVASRFGQRTASNNAHENSTIDRARKQKIVSIEPLGLKPTYCFTEPLRGMGVFANVLTYQCCTLVETYPTNCGDLDDYLKTLKVAYLYAKAVTLLPTHWAESNEVMGRNRRIGTSATGLAMFAEEHGWTALRDWMDSGYAEIGRRDRQYSEWLGVRESIKMSSVKPSGTVSLIAGTTPGVHWPVAGERYFRRVRYSKHDVMVPVLKASGYHVEPSAADPDSDVVVTFPTTGPKVRSEREVSVWEKVSLAALMQKYWADNMVSATFTFSPEEEKEIAAILRAMDGQMKSMSFLPMGPDMSEGAYKQMPYQKVSDGEFEALLKKIKPLDMDVLYASGREADGEKFCANDTCEI